ncbi:MAG: dihydrofolate reductase [Thermoanaerobaculia bacterium]
MVAVTTNGVIGRDGDLPWHLSSDLKRFKALTTGHHLIMGRKTFDSVGKPLPGRVNVVITRDPECRIDGAIVVNSIEDAIRVAEEAGDAEAFIGGGAEIFAQTLHRADRMYITRIHTELEGDTFFPDFDDVSEWQLVDSEHCEADEKNDYPFSFLTYERAAGEGHAIPPEG